MQKSARRAIAMVPEVLAARETIATVTNPARAVVWCAVCWKTDGWWWLLPRLRLEARDVVCLFDRQVLGAARPLCCPAARKVAAAAGASRPPAPDGLASSVRRSHARLPRALGPTIDDAILSGRQAAHLGC